MNVLRGTAMQKKLKQDAEKIMKLKEAKEKRQRTKIAKKSVATPCKQSDTLSSRHSTDTSSMISADSHHNLPNVSSASVEVNRAPASAECSIPRSSQNRVRLEVHASKLKNMGNAFNKSNPYAVVTLLRSDDLLAKPEILGQTEV